MPAVQDAADRISRQCTDLSCVNKSRVEKGTHLQLCHRHGLIATFTFYLGCNMQGPFEYSQATLIQHCKHVVRCVQIDPSAVQGHASRTDGHCLQRGSCCSALAHMLSHCLYLLQEVADLTAQRVNLQALLNDAISREVNHLRWNCVYTRSTRHSARHYAMLSSGMPA